MSSDVSYPSNPGMQSGNGVPSNDIGADNDRYLDTAGGDFYVKQGGVWVKQASFGGLRLQLLGEITLGETTTLNVSLGVRRYTRSLTGVATSDRLLLALTGVPQNGSLQDAYVSSPNQINAGVLVPNLGIGAVISVPVAIYKVL